MTPKSPLPSEQMYVVFDPNTGEAIAENVCFDDAAAEILQTDSREFEIRGEPGEWYLWSRQQVANIPWRRTAVLSVAESLEDATREIFEEVLAAKNWRSHYQAMTIQEWEQVQRDALA